MSDASDASSIFDGHPTIPEFAAANHKTVRTVYRWIERGDLPTVNLLGKVRIPLKQAKERLDRLASGAVKRKRGRPRKQVA